MALKKSQMEVHVPVQRLLETQTREQILSGELAPGARLPSTQELAIVWKTHPNTVQRALTPLVREGLLTRIPRVGTFVRETVSKMSRAGIYYDGDFWLDRTFAFYGALHSELQKLLRESQIELTVWVDPRNARDREKPWPALMEAAKSRAIQALIVPDVAHSWLLKVPVPTACFAAGGGGISNVVRLDFQEFTELSLQHLLEQRCRSVGMISADPFSNKGSTSDVTNADFYEHFVRRAKELGISHRKEWMRRPQRVISGDAHARFGYDQLCALSLQRERPEAVVVWPDSLAPGVLMAISEQGLFLPRDLKLILHKNDMVDLFCPVSASVAVTRVHSVASALLEQIRKQSLGERCRPIFVSFQIQHTKAPLKNPESTLQKRPRNRVPIIPLACAQKMAKCVPRTCTYG